MNATPKRVKFLSIIPILALLVSGFSILITPSSASAAAYSELSVENRARSYTYYRALASCMSGIRNEIKADAQYDGLKTDPKNGYWYGEGDPNNPDRKGFWTGEAKHEADVTPKSTSALGTTGCSEITKTGLSEYWGGATPADLLKALKYEWNGDNQWVFKGDGSQKSNYLKDFLTKQGVNMEYTPAVEYFVNYNAFVNKNFCAAKNNGAFSEQSDSIKNRYTKNNTAVNAYEGKTVYVKVTQSAGTGTEQAAYTYEGNADNPMALTGNYLLYFDNYKSCDQMAANITRTASAYTDAVLTKSCTDKGFAGAFVNACKDGMKNTANAAYCEKYTDADLKNACALGLATVPPAPPTDAGSGDAEDGEAKTSCAIGGVGWIICPVVNFLAGLADGAFTILSDTLLRIDVKLIDTTSGTYTAWTVMRNIANVAFVIVFLFIIFSQLTGMGVSNYGVKKMLPRLVVAAILVNISFFVCQLAVDLSNLFGYSMKDALGGVGRSIVEASGTGTANPISTGDGFIGIAGSVLAFAAAGVLIYAMLSVFIPVILAAVVALIMILFILIARQAIVVMLIVLSPLAFVAFLLPNTERLFKMWRKIFTAMLLLFPIIALVFGLSSLASDILRTAFSPELGDPGANGWFIEIVAAAVLVLPLFVVPSILKKSLDSIPVLGQMANKLSSRANGKLGGALKESNKGSLFARGSAMRKGARENYRTRKFAERISKGGVVGKANQVMASGLPIMAADRYANKALARTAEEVSSEALAKDVVASGKSMEGQISKDAARSIAHGRGGKSLDGKKTFKSGDVATQMAGIDKVVASNDIAGMNELWEASQSWSGADADKLRTHLANRIQSSGSKPAYFGAGALEMLRTNQHGKAENGVSSAKSLMTAAVAGNAYSPERVAKTDKDELAAVYHASESRAQEDERFAIDHGSKLSESATTALGDEQLRRGIDKNLDVVQGMAGTPGAKPIGKIE